MTDRNTPPHLTAVPGGGDAAAGAAAPQGETWDGVTKPSRRGGARRFLSDVIVELGFGTRDRVDAAVESARSAGRPPERILLDAGDLTPDQLARSVAERYGLDHLDLTRYKVDMGAANLIGSTAARRYEAVPVGFVDERTLLVAMADPANVLAIDDITIMTGLDVRPAVASQEDIAGLISRLNRLDDAVQAAVEQEEAEGAAEIVDLQESAQDAPVIKLVHSIIAQAVEQGASDIHFEPDGRELRVRFRIDGVLVPSATVPRRMVAGVVSRVKIMGNLDISERRVPQDGRVGLTIEGHHIDIRIVTLPTVHGESVVMRVLDQEAALIELERLGMLDPERERFEPLNALNTSDKNIITIEDPVEYQLDGVTQVQINPRAGLTFANGLRSMMRADPDIIMVGEIRDAETAIISVEAALTGHLVLSTLHTNDAPSAVARLIEMGIEPFLVASSIDCVVAQRLARTLCTSCKRRTLLSADQLRDNGFAASFDIEAYEPVGCGRCGGSGYKGRIGLYEVMTLSEQVRGLVLERAPADKIAAIAVAEGMRRLREDGLEKVRQGRTAITEVARVTGSG